MLNYPVTVRPDSNGTLQVEFPDLAFANAGGEDLADALANAADALEAAIEVYIAQGRPVPLPGATSTKGETVSLSAAATEKVLKWNATLAHRGDTAG